MNKITIIKGWSKMVPGKLTPRPAPKVILAGWLKPEDVMRNSVVAKTIDISGRVEVEWDVEVPNARWVRQAGEGEEFKLIRTVI